MLILRSAPRIPGHPMDLDQFEKEWSHWTAGPAPKAWAVQDMFFAMSTRLFAQVEAGRWEEKPESNE